MSRPLSSRDIEQLSAYLDGQLSPAERARLEARLAVEPAFREELAQFKATVQALRGLPEFRVPRNFTLSPALAKRPWSLPSLTYPALRLATALATAAFAFVLVLDFNAIRQAPAATPAALEVANDAEIPEASGAVTEAVSMEQAATPAASPIEGTPPEALAPSALASEEGAEADPHEDRRGTPDSTARPEFPDQPGIQGEPEISGTLEPSPERKTVIVETPTVSAESAIVEAPAAVAPTNPYRPVTLGLAGLTFLLAVLTLLSRRMA